MRALLVVTAVVAISGCSGTEGSPLGGPYGGTGSSPDPTTGTSVDMTEPTPDAGPATPRDAGPSGSSGTSGTGAPTWTKIYASSMAAGTVGDCAASGCHSQMSTAPKAYTWLKAKKQINGATSALADPKLSSLSWLGGNMPPSGPAANAASAADLAAWAAAGAPNN